MIHNHTLLIFRPKCYISNCPIVWGKWKSNLGRYFWKWEYTGKLELDWKLVQKKTLPGEPRHSQKYRPTIILPKQNNLLFFIFWTSKSFLQMGKCWSISPWLTCLNRQDKCWKRKLELCSTLPLLNWSFDKVLFFIFTENGAEFWHLYSLYELWGVNNVPIIDRFGNVLKFYAYLSNKGCSWQPESLPEACQT